ncbi:MAG: hypothetical protein JST84_21795 [Acidobacteria bacterium]|nr:hypothetical protein [Acidobacteriota bacterium]
MKKTTLVLFVTIFAATAISSGCFSKRLQAAKANQAAKAENKGNDDADFNAREEITQTFTLAPDSEVEVVGINGSVDITTSESNKAEIYILRLARSKDTFERRKAHLSFENNQLKIRGNARESSGLWDSITGDNELRTRITLKLPRKLQELSVGGCNGRVNIGEIEGGLEVHNIGGKVTVAKANGAVEFAGINGKIEATLAKLDKEGVSIHGVNGNIDLKFTEEVNAEVEMNGSNGRVNADLPNVKVEDQKHGRYHAIIGTGGPSIEVNGTNGNLWLAREGATASGTKTPTVTGKVLKTLSE